MYALEREPEAANRWRVLTAGALVSCVLCGSVLTATAHLTPRKAPVTSERIAMKVIHTKAPEPQPEPPKVEDPKPSPPEPLPKPAANKPQPMPQTEPQPMPASEAEPPAAEPEPLVLGLTLSSTTTGGKGPRFSVGNTLMGTIDRVAKEPKDRRMVRGPAPAAPSPSAAPNPTTDVRSSIKQRSEAKLQRSVTPAYPAQAKQDGIEGVVVLSITIGEDGRVETATVLRGLGFGLDESALRAARSTLWSPAKVNGEPVRSTRRFNVRFTLRG